MVTPKKIAAIAPAATSTGRAATGNSGRPALSAGLLIARRRLGRVRRQNHENTQTVAAADPFLEKAVASKAKLDTAETPNEKVAVLDELAKSIHDQAKALAKVSPDDMKSLAHMYEQVVADALVSQAKAVSPDERKKALAQCRDSLRETENEANRLAGEAPPASVQPLRDIARVAKESGNTLAQLMQQGRAS